MKVADLQFISLDNASLLGEHGRAFVGNNTLCFFALHGCGEDELKKILNYKKWILKSWKYGREEKFFVFPYGSTFDGKVVWTYAGFAPILIRYLQNKLGWIINGKENFRSKEIKLGKMFYNLWDFQRDAVNAWIKSGGYGIIKAPTSSGKTVLGCEIIKETGLRTIILVHTGDLLINVWYNYLCEQFGAVIKDKIGIIGGGLSKKDRMKMGIIGNDFYENLGKDIVIATSQSLLNHLRELGEEKFGLMVVDECHHYSAEQFKKIASVIRAKQRLGLSATVVRSDGTSPMFEGLIGSIVYRINIKDLVSKGLVVEPVFNTIIIDDEECQEKINTSNLSPLEYAQYVKKISSSSYKKRDYILELCYSLKLNKKRFMMYTDWVNDKEGIGLFTRDDYVAMLRELGIRTIGVSAEMSSKEREEVFNYLREDRIDGIVFGSLGNEGINIPVVDSVVMCNSTASIIRFPQRCGRAMRISPGKRNCFIYEVLLNTEKEIQWSRSNFYEYKLEGYKKEVIYIKDGKVIKKELGV